ncbi:glycosyltransferase [Mycobacterium sp. 1274761.0]|uniref:glycosyltransferase n=1 Tax=Mycobacterium sp. 1274761.0 TaxID=1834077 RepID=UPI0008001876|nr:glycosyltransferase [Mycobacterium sp. 1274761.0]OBK79196.1 glycosyl transferase family 1 [Mycobacterium sp. 1274761.0]
MKFALASYGSRGDIEPGAAVARELLRRGHEVSMAVPPDSLGFIKSAGLSALGYGVDAQAWLDLWMPPQSGSRKFPNPTHLWHELWKILAPCWEGISTTLTSLANGADLLFTGPVFEQPAANVAEYYDIPFATYHYTPIRPNGQARTSLPPRLNRLAMTLNDWLLWRVLKRLEDEQRRDLGLQKVRCSSSRRIAARGSLEIQAYDEVCFPGLAIEWSKFKDQRPFVGALTMELATDADEEVASWIAEGTPPIFFGFGSMPVASAADTFALIASTCKQLGVRALISSGWSDFSRAPRVDGVKLVSAVNHADIFPKCRAVVHHGGSGTTATGLRAGVPTLVLWKAFDQPIWGAQVKRLQVGTARPFARTTSESLVADLRTIIAPQYVSRAREIATRMTPPAVSVATAADLLEKAARHRMSC